MHIFRKSILVKFLIMVSVLFSGGFLFKPPIKAIYCSYWSKDLTSSNEDILKDNIPNGYGFNFWIFNSSNGQLYTYDPFFNILKPFKNFEIKSINGSITNIIVNESFIKDSKLLTDITVTRKMPREEGDSENLKIKIDLKKTKMLVESEWYEPNIPYCKFIDIPKNAEIIEE